MKKYLIFVLMLTMSCTNEMIKQQTTIAGSKPHITQRIEGDTTQYIFGFSEKRELKKFTKDFNTFLDVYPFDTLLQDTISQYLCLRFMNQKDKKPENIEDSIVLPDRDEFTEEDLTPEYQVHLEEELFVPIPKGKVALYINRKKIDTQLYALIQSLPFVIRDDDSLVVEDTINYDFFTIKQINPVKFRIKCNENSITYTGKQLSAFDIVQGWTTYTKKHPAEGAALFYNVKGIKEFVKGEEAIIRGFSAIDSKTIDIQLSKPDPFALQRLQSTRLIPISLKTGYYRLDKKQKNSFLFMRNKKHPFNRVFLDQFEIIMGNDKNPIVSYSLNKYDLIVLYRKKDLEYAKRALLKNSNLIPFLTDYYFISLASKMPEVRTYLKKLIKPALILNNSVKAEGELLTSLTDLEVPLSPDTANVDIKKPEFSEPIVILYDVNDPVSIHIAEKLFSDYSLSGTPSKLVGLSGYELEIALIRKQYDLAIGWASQKIKNDKTEQLRISSIWFANNNNEKKRIQNDYEKPLFSVQRYALCKKNIKFFNNKLTGLYLESESESESE